MVVSILIILKIVNIKKLYYNIILWCFIFIETKVVALNDSSYSHSGFNNSSLKSHHHQHRITITITTTVTMYLHIKQLLLQDIILLKALNIPILNMMDGLEISCQ